MKNWGCIVSSADVKKHTGLISSPFKKHCFILINGKSWMHKNWLMEIALSLFNVLYIYTINFHRLPLKYLCAEYFIRIFMMIRSGEATSCLSLPGHRIWLSWTASQETVECSGAWDRAVKGRSTEYAYVHLSAHMETPEFRWFNLPLHPTSIIWQNICTQQSSLLACLLCSDRILKFSILQAPRRTQSAYQEDWVLHNMQQYLPFLSVPKRVTCFLCSYCFGPSQQFSEQLHLFYSA